MTDRYENIRRALAKGPTPGPWIVTHELRECDETVCDLVNGTWIVTAPGVKLAHWEYDAAHISACDPDAIRELLAERDQLAAALEAAREDAERYRWLRDEDGLVCLPYEDHGIGPEYPRHEELDAAIDRARGKENGNG